MPSLCPSVVPVKLADNFLERRVVKKLYGGPPKEMSVEEIDEVVGKFVVAAKVVKLAGVLLPSFSASLSVTYLRLIIQVSKRLRFTQLTDS